MTEALEDHSILGYVILVDDYSHGQLLLSTEVHN